MKPSLGGVIGSRAGFDGLAAQQSSSAPVNAPSAIKADPACAIARTSSISVESIVDTFGDFTRISQHSAEIVAMSAVDRKNLEMALKSRLEQAVTAYNGILELPGRRESPRPPTKLRIAKVLRGKKAVTADSKDDGVLRDSSASDASNVQEPPKNPG